MYEPTFRPLINVIRITPDLSCVEVALEMGGRSSTGFGDLPDGQPEAGEGARLTAAAAAVCAAVTKLLPDGHLVRLDWLQRTEVEPAEHPTSVINSGVSFAQPGEGVPERLVGAALVHSDPCVAAVRATLDGLTRRLAPAVLLPPPSRRGKPLKG